MPSLIAAGPTAADFGADLAVIPDLGSYLPVIGGNRMLGEALARRLTTPRGSLFYAPAYGTDIRIYLNAGIDRASLFRMKTDIEREASRDSRIAKATATLTFDEKSRTVSVAVQCTTKEGPFQLTLSVSALTVALLAVK